MEFHWQDQMTQLLCFLFVGVLSYSLLFSLGETRDPALSKHSKKAHIKT